MNVAPGARTGLKSSSQVMVDKIVSVPRSVIARTVGRCDHRELEEVDDAVRRWLML